MKEWMWLDAQKIQSNIRKKSWTFYKLQKLSKETAGKNKQTKNIISDLKLPTEKNPYIQQKQFKS